MSTQDTPPAPFAPRLIGGIALALLAACLLMRFYRLGSLPGINGDEAWMGVAVRDWAAGRGSLQTPTGNFVNPFFIVTEWPLAALFGARPLFLRLPAALWNLAGLAAFWALYRRAAGCPREALLAAATLACLPGHLCNSRTGWDPSFVLAAAPVMLAAGLLIAEEGWRARWAAVLAGAALAGLWIHMTTLVFVGLMGAGLWAVEARRALGQPAPERRRQLARSLAIAAAFALATAAACLLLARLSHHPVAGLASEVVPQAREIFSDRQALIMDLNYQALAISGLRAFEYFAGTPPGPAALAGSVLCLLVFVVGAGVLLSRSRRPLDVCVGAVALAAVPVIVALRGLYHLERIGSERYVLWLVPLFAVILVRMARLLSEKLKGWPAAGLALFAAANLGMAGRNYFVAAARLEHRATQPRTFWTGPREPKAEAARLIGELAARGRIAGVWAEDWWIYQPLRFCLSEKIPIHSAWEVKAPAAPPAEGALVLAGWADGNFIAGGLKHYAGAARIERTDIMGGDGRPVISILVIRKL